MRQLTKSVVYASLVRAGNFKLLTDPFYFFDPTAVRGPLACFRLWLSAAAMCLLLRRWNLSASAAFLGGVCWMFAPFNIRWLHWPLAHSSLWLPIMVLALDRLIVAEAMRSKLRALVVASLAAVVLQLAGHPETQFQAGVAAGGSTSRENHCRSE